MSGIDAKSDAIYELVEEGSGVEQLATGFTFTEGPIWHPGEQVLYFSDMPGDVRRKVTLDGDGDRGPEAVLQVQRDDARRRPQPARLRARHELARARAHRRRARDARLPLRGQVPEQPERRLRPLRRDDLLLRPVVRALSRLRDRARAGARLAGRLPDPAGRRAGRARPRRRRRTSSTCRTGSASRPTSRCMYINDTPRAHIKVFDVERRRDALERAHVLRGRRHGRDRGGHPRRDEVRRARATSGSRGRRASG